MPPTAPAESPVQAGPRYPVMSLGEFRARVARGEQPGEVMLRTYGAVAPVQRAPGDTTGRVRRFAITSERVDRESDTIAMQGWDLSEYRRNPVVLWAHDYRDLPVARSTRLFVEQGQGGDGQQRDLLFSDDQFPDPGVYPFADTVLALVDGGFLNATSVGFLPTEWAFDENRRGVNFLQQELLEHSIVPVPANPDALIAARSAGIDTRPLREWCERALDDIEGEPGIWIPRSKLVGAMRALDNGRSVHMGADPQNDDPAGAVERAAITYARAHPDGTPKAPEDEKWDGPGEVAKTDQAQLHVICAWYDKAAPDNDGDGWPDVKGAYKLPHHRGSGSHALVWRGVRAAAGRLPNSDIPDADVAGVQAHLGKHYREFDKTPPWDANSDAWEAYCAAAVGLGARVTDTRRALLLEAHGFDEEAAALRVEEPAAAPPVPPSTEPPAPADDGDTLDIDADELRAIADEAFAPLKQGLTALDGRVD